jgi:MFS family permease
MSEKRGLGIWFAATAVTFLTRAMLFSTWQSRSPEVMHSLHLNTTQMGLLVMLFPVGGALGILFASSLMKRFGVGRMTIAGFAIGSISLAGLAFTIPAGNVFASAAFVLTLGLPMAFADFASNYEATEVDKKSKRSLLPLLHSTFGVGMMLAATFSGWLLSINVGIGANYLIVAGVSLAASVWAGLSFPKSHFARETASEKSQRKVLSRVVWSENRTLVIAFIGVSFIIAELSAGTWMPIALERSGFSAADAANALGLFWIAITVTRVVGGFVVDKLGRFRTILLSTLVTSVGISFFIFNEIIHQPYLGLIIWACGLALGFPMAANAQSDNAERSPFRINLMITLVYIASISVGPLLGSIGQSFGLYVAFSVPLALMLISALLSGKTKPERL